MSENEFPVPCAGNLITKVAEFREFRLLAPENAGSKIHEFPVNSLQIRELAAREGSAQDCVAHHLIFLLLYTNEALRLISTWASRLGAVTRMPDCSRDQPSLPVGSSRS